jgi:hypothetical protein
MTDDESRFTEAIRRIDQANGEDPRSESFEGAVVPREFAFSRRVYAWIERLADQPSEALLLAARAHTLRRWHIPRDRYPKTRGGYHAWRRALAQFHADQADAILTDAGYGGELRARVRALIIRQDWRADPEGQALEDADCLAFLELKLHTYLDDWDPDKTVGILRKTMAKMTPRAIELAKGLRLDPRCVALLDRAAGG